MGREAELRAPSDLVQSGETAVACLHGIAGRRQVRPRARVPRAWFALERFHTLPLGPLEDAEARSVLEQQGIRAGDAARLNRIARGHPLALMLASAGVSEHPEHPGERNAPRTDPQAEPTSETHPGRRP